MCNDKDEPKPAKGLTDEEKMAETQVLDNVAIRYIKNIQLVTFSAMF